MKRHIKLFVYTMARILGLFALSRFLTRSRIRILAYHGGSMSDEHHFNPHLFISPATLERRVRWLDRKGFHVVPLSDAVATEKAFSLPPLPTVITFDDGWYTTASLLIPLLARRQLPSTLYLSTKYMEDAAPVRPVVTQYILANAKIDVFEVVGFGGEIDGRYSTRDVSRLNELRRAVDTWLDRHARTREEVCAALGRLAECVGWSASALNLESRRFDYLTRSELQQLPVLKCNVEMHGHVHRYPKGDPDAFREDIALCHQAFRRAGLPAPEHYCYPSGRFDMHAEAVLHDSGLRTAVTCKPGLIRRITPSNRYVLPRFLDGDHISQLEFEAEMSGFAVFFRKSTAM
jgi:peptidoglycan/xylan/chitin deacetylase (PgdA/CDA1 family)